VSSNSIYPTSLSAVTIRVPRFLGSAAVEGAGSLVVAVGASVTRSVGLGVEDGGSAAEPEPSPQAVRKVRSSVAAQDEVIVTEGLPTLLWWSHSGCFPTSYERERPSGQRAFSHVLTARQNVDHEC
jgi:hypothetical protein